MTQAQKARRFSDVLPLKVRDKIEAVRGSPGDRKPETFRQRAVRKLVGGPRCHLDGGRGTRTARVPLVPLKERPGAYPDQRAAR